MSTSMTAVQKILAAKAAKSYVEPGEIVMAQVDLACVDDIQIRIMVRAFEKIADRVWDYDRALVIADHLLPPATISQAEAVKALREFGATYGLKNVILTDGIKHEVFRSQGLVVPGMLVVATDSHTNTAGALGAFATALGPTDVAVVFKEGQVWLRVPETIQIELVGQLARGVFSKDVGLVLLTRHGSRFGHYKAIEFVGPALADLSLDERMTLTNLTTEMGAKASYMAPDRRIVDYAETTGRPYTVFESDSDAPISKRLNCDLSEVTPMVAAPPSPDNGLPVGELLGETIHQAFIGTCTNGRYDDFQAAAEVLRGHQVAPGVRLLIIPASRAVYERMLNTGLAQLFSEAGAVLANANCGPCAGLHQGTLAAGEVMICTGPRNFIGRAGHRDSRIYLASPATVAASAIEGRIADPRDHLN